MKKLKQLDYVKTIIPEEPKPEMKPDWQYFEDFLTREQADWLYDRMLKEPWKAHSADGRDAAEILYGPMYVKDGGQVSESAKHIVPEIPPFLNRLSQLVSDRCDYLINAVQAHKYGPGCHVKPHHDPYGCIAMIVVGQERVFRVGGKMEGDFYKTSQAGREVSGHSPKEEILLRHGSLLVFYGNRVVHSMFPTAQDARFNPNGRDWRISILFRYSTPAIRK